MKPDEPTAHAHEGHGDDDRSGEVHVPFVGDRQQDGAATTRDLPSVSVAVGTRPLRRLPIKCSLDAIKVEFAPHPERDDPTGAKLTSPRPVEGGLLVQPSCWPYVERKTRRGERVFIPAVEVGIFMGDVHVAGGRVQLDSGADRTHLPASVEPAIPGGFEACEELGMEWGEDWKTVVYAPPGTWVAKVAGLEVPLRPVIGRDFGNAVLGRDFMESFTVTFDGRGRSLLLEPYPEELS